MDDLRIEARTLSTGKTVAYVPGLRQRYAADTDWETRAVRHLAGRVARMRHRVELLAFYGFRPPGRLLEVGTGPGLDTRLLLAFSGATVVSIDVAQLFVPGPGEPRAHQSLHHHLDGWRDNGFRIPAFRDTGRVRFLEMDARALGFAAGTFDAVVCKATLNLIPRGDLAVAEALRVLRPGGLLLISEAPFSGLFGLCRGGVTDVPWAHLYLTEAEFQEILPPTPAARARALPNWRAVQRLERETVMDAVGDGALLVAERYSYEDLPAPLLDAAMRIVPALKDVGRDRLRTAEAEWLFRRA
jgi:ubiquinone/menaquinone biosynthesis C-methylase UbiE